MATLALNVLTALPGPVSAAAPPTPPACRLLAQLPFTTVTARDCTIRSSVQGRGTDNAGLTLTWSRDDQVAAVSRVA